MWRTELLGAVLAISDFTGVPAGVSHTGQPALRPDISGANHGTAQPSGFCTLD